MDDQFGGRTDDDLFYDDFEPVESETIVVQEVQIPHHPPEPTPVAPAPPSAPAQPSQPRQQKPKKSSPPANASTNEAPPTSSSQPQAKGGNLSSSRFARKGNANQKQQSTPPPPPATKSPVPSQDAKDKPKGIQHPESKETKETDGASPPPNAPTAPSKEKKPHGSQSTAANPQARLGSGGNPRQKLTEEELATKMEQMKLLSAEKARKFEKAEKDEKQHAEAYAKGMENARKRRAEDAERRRRGEDDKRKLDEERAKNRERKLKAMGMKEGGWDEGKAAALEEEARKGFRGANGGVRGTRRGGLSGSRFAAAAREGEEEHPDVDRFLDERHRGGGGGRGRGGRGGGGRGRGGFDRGPSSKPTSSNGPAPTLTADEFPALPSDGSKKTSDNAAVPVYPPLKTGPAPPIPSLSTPPPPGSKWDDEMEALDELKKQGQS